jgi:hypothetical protein
MLYKDILMKTHSIYHNSDPSTKTPKSSKGKKWKELLSQIWKEIKPAKSGSGIWNLGTSVRLGRGLIKYSNDPIEYKYIDNLNQLQQRLYYIYAQEKAGNNNFHNEKMGIKKVINDQLDKNIDNPKGTEYLKRVINNLPKGIITAGSGAFNTLLNKLSNVMPELHIPGYNFCGPFTKLDKRLSRGNKPVNKLDAGCKEHDIFCRYHKDTKERHC